MTNKVNGARDKATFDFIELVCPENVGIEKIIIFLPPLMTEIEMFSGQATLTNKVNSARDKANFDFIELVCPENVGIKKIIIFLPPLMTEIGMVSLVVKRP